MKSISSVLCLIFFKQAASLDDDGGQSVKRSNKNKIGWKVERRNPRIGNNDVTPGVVYLISPV
jgi:hypothetical protein